MGHRVRFEGWLVVAALVIAAFLPMAARAAEAPADTAALEAEYDRLFQQMLADPANLDLMFRFAALATRLGNYESAISTLERMLLFNRDLPRVKLELGVLYYRLGSYVIARNYLDEAIAGGDAPALVVERVETYLDEIDRRLSRHFFSGSVQGGIRYQSNANAGPASDLVRVLGIDATLDDEFLGSPDANVFFAGSLQHDYDMRMLTVDSWQTNATLFATRQFEFGELDVVFAEMRTGPRVPVMTETNQELDIQPYVMTNVLTLDDRLHFYSFGGGVAFDKQFGDQVSVGGGYEFRHKEFQDSMTRPTNDLQTSDDHVFRLAGQYFVTDNVLLGLTLNVVDENARAAFESNVEVLVGGSVAVQYDAPFGLTDWPWRVDVAATGIITDYDAPDPLIDPLVTRSDREWRIDVTNTVNFDRDWSAFVHLGYQENDSNLPNFTFTNFTTTAGVTRRF